jgi:hypothetical protein
VALVTTVVELDERWRIAGHLNGGYLAAVLGQVASAAADGAPVLTVSAHYLARVRSGGPVPAAVEVLRRGRLSTVQVLLGGAEPQLAGLVTVGVPTRGGPEHAADPAPSMPPWDDCDPSGAAWAGPGMELVDHVEMRIHPADVAAMGGQDGESGAVLRSWVAYHDGRPPDDLLVMAAWDLLPPSLWVAHVWGRYPTVAAQVSVFPGPGPAAGPLVVRSATRTLADGSADEAAAVWDAGGRLLVSARQTAVYVLD